MGFDPKDNLTVNREMGLEQAVLAFEKWFCWWSLEKNSFNQTRAAAELKIHRNSLQRRVLEWGWNEKVHAAYVAANSGEEENSSEVESPIRGVVAGHAPRNQARP